MAWTKNTARADALNETEMAYLALDALNEMERLSEQCSTCEKGFAAAMDELLLAIPQQARELKPGTVACVKAYIAHLEALSRSA